MKDDFSIIDLDQTDTIPSGEVLAKVIDDDTELHTEEFIDEDYAEELPDSDVKNVDVADDINDMSSLAVDSSEMEDYGYDAEPILADVKILPQEDASFSDKEDAYGPDVFQGEVSMDTAFMDDIAREIKEREEAQAQKKQKVQQEQQVQEELEVEEVIYDLSEEMQGEEYEGEEYEGEEYEGEEYEGEEYEDEEYEGEEYEDEEYEGEEYEDEEYEGEEFEDEEYEGEEYEDEEYEDEEYIDESEEDAEAEEIDEDLEFFDENNNERAATKRKEGKSDKNSKASKKDKADNKNAKASKKNDKKKKGLAGLWHGILLRIKDFSATDWALAGGGLVIIIVAIVVLVVWTGTKRDIAETSNMYAIGSQISELGIAGESGLLAVTDLAAMKSIEIETEEPEEEVIEEVVSENGIDIKVTFTSVEQDLKIKFINDETDKLITNVVFEVKLKDKKDKETILKDEDQDGIIYEKPMKSGEYTVELTPMEGYNFVSCDEKITVKEKIVYEQIDVRQEIKTEAEVNVAIEDTAVNVAEKEQKAEEAAQPAEEKVTDTVEWVESTRTPIEGNTDDATGYNQIDKNTINEPNYATGKLNVLQVNNEILADKNSMSSFYYQRVLTKATDYNPIIFRTEEEIKTDPEIATEEPTEKPTETPVDEPTEEPTEKATETPTERPTEKATEEPTERPTEKATETPTERPTEKVTEAPTEKPTEEPTEAPSSTPSIVPSAKPSSSKPDVKVDKVKLLEDSFVIKPGKSKAIVATAYLTDKTMLTDASMFEYESSNEAVAIVDEEGVVTGDENGKAKITVSYTDTYGRTKTATCTVTVSDLTVKEVSFKEKEVSVPDGETLDLLVTAVMSDDSKVTDAAKFKWESSKENIATVKNGTVTAKEEGSTVIKAIYTDGSGNSEEASCTVKVVKNTAGDTSSKLKDKNGNQVYVKDSDGKYVEATYADYYTASAFYLKTEVKYKYTGWQTIDGNVYFYDKNNNKVTGDQIIQGVKYHFTDEGILAMDKKGKLGIDVSKWNGNIDWNAVKNSGISYVIIRCGYRGSTTGVLVEDPTFKSNIKGATAAGLKVGVYFFTQAVNEVEAVEEASMALSLVKGYGISYPIFIDTEQANGRADRIDKATRTAVCKAFCETIRSGGYTPGIYASKFWFYDNVNYNSLSSYRIWLAQYTAEPSFSYRYDLWQYSSKGSVSGIKGKVDMNWSYLGY